MYKKAAHPNGPPFFCGIITSLITNDFKQQALEYQQYSWDEHTPLGPVIIEMSLK